MTGSAPVLTTKPLFFYNWFCPYAQRVYIALQAKGVDHDEYHIDLMVPRPSWYLDFNPQGKVPLICYQEGDKRHCLNESLLLLDWVEEYQQTPTLLPASAGERTRARLIAARYDTKFVNNWLKLMFRVDNPEEAQVVGKELQEELQWLESQLDPHGPYFLGPDLTTLDAAVLPWLLRDYLTLQFKGVDLFAELPKLKAYKEAAEKHPAVQAALVPHGGGDFKSGLIEVYAKHTGQQLPTSHSKAPAHS